MIPDACFFQKNGLSNNQMTNTMNQPINDQETLKGIIDQYLNNGCDVAQPMVIIFDEDDSDRHELTDWLRNHEGKGLGVDGHPFKRGHRHFINENGETELIANHPELTSKFYPPAGYSDEVKYLWSAGTYDHAFKVPYYAECVRELKVPFVYLAPIQWFGGDYTNMKEQHEPVTPDLSDFIQIHYSRSFEDWKEWALQPRKKR